MGDADRLCLCGWPGKDTRWAGHARFVWERTASACAETRTATVATFGRKEGVRLEVRIGNGGRGEGTLWVQLPGLRTIVEREYVPESLARRAQQQIRLHEVTRTQQRRLALVF